MTSINEIIDNLKDRGSTRDRNEAIQALGGLPDGGLCVIRAQQLELASNVLERQGHDSLANACRESAKMLRQIAMPTVT
jgi:hypothetical protein